MHFHIRRVLFVAAAAVALGAAAVMAQSTRPQEPDVLTALLAEVRGLRQAIEHTSTAGARVQLALGRLQLQEQRVNAMIRRGESLREAIAKAEKDAAAAQAQLAMIAAPFKEKPGEAADEGPDDIPVMAEMLASLKKAVAGAAAEVHRLQTEEALLQQQIAGEQGRWLEINRALEDLERALAKGGRE